ncbi:MFS transporter [Nitratireductor mangrovi]|uniref:MFS transporter n=1 Tax=Nitratireductor mangrovi TaxID=2599600 RepID=A0A5B8L009_9HYPH|nr:MFS transporter [Nitratireductor mangrovi]QDZ00918.1 MFS transporter [Nitratireductor mangrovi]
MTAGFNEKEARRTALILASASAIVGAAAPISISIGGLAGLYLLGADKSLATAPVTAYTLGVALGALPLAWLVRRVGQRNGFISGTVATAVGSAVATLALFDANFWLFALGLLVIGFGGASVQQYRFAAADNAPSHFKARAISTVLAGGVVMAIVGPQVVIFTRDLFAPVMFAGSFAAVIGLAALGAIILSFLRLHDRQAVAVAASDAPVRPLGTILRQPRFVVSLLCAIGSYALMSFVMTGAPLAMVGCGFTPDEAALGISWHVMAMFAPSFVTGRLIARFGKETIVAIGLILLLGCAAVALSGIALWQFWSALILLGIGWNFGFIGATAMVSETYSEAEKGKVQGIHDFFLFGSVAFASLMSGQVYNAWGWEMLNWIIFPVVVGCIAALALLVAAERRRVAA